jgi:hypothetical protein
MPKKTSKKRSVNTISKPGIMRNQFFGMMLVAIGVGALIVVMRYFVISLQVPTDIYEISTQQLIPGAN